MTKTLDSSRTALDVAVAAKAAQMSIRANLMRDTVSLWPLLDKTRIGDTFPGWATAMSLLVRRYHGQSSQAAGRAYQVTRELHTQSPAPRSLLHIAPEPDEEWMTRAFGFAGPGMLERDTARPNTALSTTLGTATRIALDGGRTTTLDTVEADPIAVGWYRVTDASPCAFCALLASRGVVYKSDSFEASNARFAGDGEAKVHNHCGCSFAAAFSHDQNLPDASQTAMRVYKDRGDGDALVAFRKAWNEHLATQETSRPTAGGTP